VQFAFLTGDVLNLSRKTCAHASPVHSGILHVGIGDQNALSPISETARQQHGQGSLASTTLLIDDCDDFRAHAIHSFDPEW
jgi:hypothetical protein